MILENGTRYETRDLRKFFAAGLRHLGAEGHRRIQVVYRRGDSPYVTGWATLGGTTIRLRLPRPGNLSLVDLAYVFEHEVMHNLGVRHKDMDRECYRCHGGSSDQLPEWAQGLIIGVKAEAPKPTMADHVARREEKARKMLDRWDRKLRLARTMRGKWASKVAYYERRKSAAPTKV